MTRSRAVQFDCAGETLHGVLEMPANPERFAVLIPVGGPQYRAGSHRQFVLLARALRDAGFASLRFDYRGMGDSSGDMRDFEAVAEDLAAAASALQREVPGVRGVVAWGLCDAAAAAVLHLARDPRITGMVLVNPWARSEQGLARAIVGSYYRERLLDARAWLALFSRPKAAFVAIGSAVSNVWQSVRPGKSPRAADPQGDAPDARPLPDRLLAGFEAFRGPVLIVISGSDITGNEFAAVVRGSRRWRRRIARRDVTWRELPGANHTFSTHAWRTQVFDWTVAWLRERVRSPEHA
jgi:exosortase A-associated hydrolase 1